MSRWRRAAKVDDAQAGIVQALRSIPGVTVQTGHDDLLVGCAGRSYWYEIKSGIALRKDGKTKAGAVKESQRALLAGWRGHYRIVSTVDEILADLGMA